MTAIRSAKWPTDRGEPIPEDRIIRNCPTPTCQFCGGPNHYGWCDDMRAEWDSAVKHGRGRPVPIIR